MEIERFATDYMGEDLERGPGWRRWNAILVYKDGVTSVPMLTHDDIKGQAFVLIGEPPWTEPA